MVLSKMEHLFLKQILKKSDLEVRMRKVSIF